MCELTSNNLLSSWKCFDNILKVVWTHFPTMNDPRCAYIRHRFANFVQTAAVSPLSDMMHSKDGFLFYWSSPSFLQDTSLHGVVVSTLSGTPGKSCWPPDSHRPRRTCLMERTCACSLRPLLPAFAPVGSAASWRGNKRHKRRLKC